MMKIIDDLTFMKTRGLGLVLGSHIVDGSSVGIGLSHQLLAILIDSLSLSDRLVLSHNLRNN